MASRPRWRHRCRRRAVRSGLKWLEHRLLQYVAANLSDVMSVDVAVALVFVAEDVPAVGVYDDADEGRCVADVNVKSAREKSPRAVAAFRLVV